MPSIFAALTEGLEHQRAGRLAQAEALYEAVLRCQPGNPDALHLLGLAAQETGRLDTALDLVGRAIAILPEFALFHNSLGLILHARGQSDEAGCAFEAALQLDPACPQAHLNFGNLLQDLGLPGEAMEHYTEALRSMPQAPEIHNSLGNAQIALGRLDQAETCLRAALDRRPDYPEALANLAAVLDRMDRAGEAEICCRKALRLRPELPQAWSNLAAVLIRQERLADAEACCREALRLQPAFAEAWCNLGRVCNESKRFADAEECCRKALRYRPSHPESWNNLGIALEKQDRVEEALNAYRRAVCLRPRYADGLANLGAALCGQGSFSEALSTCEAALDISPQHADARLNRAILLLLQGRMEEGWREYEWRWKKREMPPRQFSQPAWDGAPLARRTLLVTAEQGLGDTIQFVRYLPLIERQGGRVLLECQPRLLPLLQNCAGADDVIAADSPLPDFDLHIPLLSLPRLRGEAPPAPPYLHVDDELVDTWGSRLPAEDRLRVGLCWAGNPDHPQDQKRSILVDHLRPLAELPGINWYSLQRGITPPAWLRQIEDASAGITHTAALILNLDVVISADTMIAHLAGALGRPVWILLPFVPDWRWLLDRRDSPWYPSARLFRQTKNGHWQHVVESVKLALTAEVARLTQALPGRDSGKINFKNKGMKTCPSRFKQT